MKTRATFKEKLNLFDSLDSTSLKKPIPSLVVFFKPDHYVENINQININALKKVGIEWLIININIDDSKDPRIKKLSSWISKVQKLDIKIMLLSNRSNRRVNKTLKAMNVGFDAVITKAFKPVVLRREKIMSYINDFDKAYLISNDFLFDTPSSKFLGIETTIIEENFLKLRWIDKKFHSYQKRVVTFFLKRKNMINKHNDFRVGESQFDEFL